MSDTEHKAKSEVFSAQRIEIFTGAGRRRTWPATVKAEIVAESERPGESVCAVARRHGLTPQQLFGWRREARRKLRMPPLPKPVDFVPVISDTPEPAIAMPKMKRKKRKPPPRPACVEAAVAVEIESGATMIRVRHGASERLVAAVLAAMKIAR
jgi:transposase